MQAIPRLLARQQISGIQPGDAHRGITPANTKKVPVGVRRSPALQLHISDAGVFTSYR
jgi:hypothetical protein